jgi:hypothetical protein
MQPRERADQVFSSHRVVSENGFEKIVLAELDPLMRGRVLLLLEAKAIVAALAGVPAVEVEAPKFFVPSAIAAPEHVSPPASVATDPQSAAFAAAQSTEALNEQFARAA